ncbi:MAG: citrate lyase subunit alpha [Enterobacter hormaechei]
MLPPICPPAWCRTRWTTSCRLRAWVTRRKRWAARVTSNPRELMIARYAADVLNIPATLTRAFVQTGSCAATACTRFMEENGAQRQKARFALGGITGTWWIAREGLIEKAAQCFDGQAAASRATRTTEISTTV